MSLNVEGVLPEAQRPDAKIGRRAGKLARFLELPWLEKAQALAEYYWLLKTRYYYRRFWGRIGDGSKIIKPMRLRNVDHIEIGDHVVIHQHAFLLTLQEDKAVVPRMIIGDRCVIGHMNHFTCIHDVRIGKDVLTADRVYISDHSHHFSDPMVPIMKQSAASKGTTSIGDGSWIGENAAILSCHIGKNCVIGANAVVISDIPDYSVAVGIPARVIRKYNPASRCWERVEQSGE